MTWDRTSGTYNFFLFKIQNICSHLWSPACSISVAHKPHSKTTFDYLWSCSRWGSRAMLKQSGSSFTTTIAYSQTRHHLQPNATMWLLCAQALITAIWPLKTLTRSSTVSPVNEFWSTTVNGIVAVIRTAISRLLLLNWHLQVKTVEVPICAGAHFHSRGWLGYYSKWGQANHLLCDMWLAAAKTALGAMPKAPPDENPGGPFLSRT